MLNILVKVTSFKSHHPDRQTHVTNRLLYLDHSDGR